MIHKIGHLNRPFLGEPPHGSRRLEEDGHFLARGVLTPEKVGALRSEIESVYRDFEPDWRPGSGSREHAEMFRYELFNRSPMSQKVLGCRSILDVLEPLLGGDCHLVSCTSWRNPAGSKSAPRGQQWHVDGGPYVARASSQPWPSNIPYPIFVVTAQIYLQSVTIDDGPTAVLPGSHKSGQLPPVAREWDVDLEYEGRPGEVHLANAGDVTFFVSDAWHRRMPTTDACKGRFFIQAAYGRREIAQRIRLSSQLNAVSPEALERAVTKRQRQLLGIHDAVFYDG